MAVKIILLAVFFAVTIAIGIFFRKKASSVGNFVLGGRSIGPWLTAFAYGTTYFSAVIFVGYAGQFGWNMGISAVWIGLGNAFIGSLAAWAVLAKRTRTMTKHLDSSTMPEFFDKRYDSKGLKLASAILIFIFLIPYTASVYKGISQMFATALGIDYFWCVAVMAVITGLYVVLGGYVATAINDVIQGVIMLVGIIAVVASILAGKGGFTSALTQLSQVPSASAPQMQGALTSFFGPQPLALLSVVILTSLGVWGMPQMVHKFYAIKNERSIKAGTVISTIFALVIGGGAYFLGAFGPLFYTPGADGKVVFDNIMPTMLTNNLSDFLIGVVLVLLLCASMSTLASLVITSSSTFVLDFIKGSLKKDLKEKGQLGWIRGLCALFILISAVIALTKVSLITVLMSLSWGALAGAFLGPFLYGLFLKKATKTSVWASFVVGVGIMVLNLFVPFTKDATATTVAGAIAIMSSFVTVPLFSLFTKKPDPKHVEQVFSCFNKPGEATAATVPAGMNSEKEKPKVLNSK
ncbi:MAG TPA: sodium:solute symporter family protein [Oscillospiraceae bacterium]|nr:sodium:solute symporter family protein [Oscillospiraceae bacterium]